MEGFQEIDLKDIFQKCYIILIYIFLKKTVILKVK